MHSIYSLVAGPLAWIAFLLFFGGILLRLIQMLVLAVRKERFLFTYMSLHYGLRSIARWIVPFATTNWRNHPVLTTVTFVFHICLIFTPILLVAHVILVDESWGLSWWALPDALADAMAIIVIAGAIFFLLRRLIRPEVKFVTDFSDYLLLVIVALPFLTGIAAYHQWGDVGWVTIVHMLSGEIMLVTIPFTRLSHMIFAPFTRAYMGSEFGKVRHAKDW